MSKDATDSELGSKSLSSIDNEGVEDTQVVGKLNQHCQYDSDATALGLWAKSPRSSLKYQEKLRSEWD